MEDTLTIPEEVQADLPPQQDPPSKKLYNALVGEKLYTKSYDEFTKQFSSKDAIDKLHKGLSEENLYTKDGKEFESQYFPDVKKKGNTGSNALPPVPDKGSSDIPKAEKSSQPKFSLNDYVLPETQKAMDNRNVAISTEAVQPKITASYDDFIAHNAERKEKKSKLVSEAIENTAKKVLKNKGVIKPEEEGKALNLSQYQQLTREKQRLQEAYDNGDATFAISKDGEVGLNKTIGWWDALSKGWNGAMKANDEAAEFADLNAEGKVAFLKKQEAEQPQKTEYIGERGSASGSIGKLVGENAPFLVKAAEGTAAGAGLVALAPETLGASLTGLPAAMAFAFTANDSKNQGIQQEVTRRYYQLKQENPDANEVELMRQAEQGALVGGLTGIGINAALMTSFKKPLSLESKGVLSKSISKAISNSVYGSSATATLEGVKLAEGNLEGIKTTPTEIAKQMGKTFTETATTLGLLHVLTGAVTKTFNLPKTVRSAIKYALAKEGNPTEISATLKANEEAGNIPKGTSEAVSTEINNYKEALGKTVEGLSPEAEASVAGLIEAKTKLIEEAKTKDSSAKPFYDEKIAGIDEQIQKTLNTGKPYAHEINEISGEKYSSEKPTSVEEILAPKSENKPIQNEDVTSINKLPIPEVPIREMNSQQLEDYSRVLKKHLKDQEVEFFGEEGAKKYREAQSISNSSFASKESRNVADKLINDMEATLTKEQNDAFFGVNQPEGMYDPSEIRDVSTRVRLVEESENVQDLGGTLKLPLLDFLLSPDNEGTLAVLNAAKNKAVELNIDPKEMLAEALKRIAKDLPDKTDRVDLANSIIEKLNKPNEVISQANIENKQGNISTEAEVPNAEPVSKVVEPTETGGGAKEPPPTEPIVDEGKQSDRFRDKGVLNRLVTAENIPKAAREGFKEKGLKYKVASKEEAVQVAKSVIDQYGIDDAVLLAEANKFKGGVNGAIFSNALTRLFNEELSAKTPEAKLDAAKRFAEIGIRKDEFHREQGRDISEVDHFYKKSPLGIKLMEEARRREDFDQYSKNKDKSWKEFFDEMTKDPEFEKEFKGKVQEELKKERAEARAKRIKKVDAFFDDAIKKLDSGGAAYSTFIPITPKALKGALEGMKKAYHAGEKVAKVIEDAIDYISKEVGGGWDKEAFRKEWDAKLGEQDAKTELPADKREKLMERFKKKLKGLSDKEKEDVIRKSFKKLIENGALDYPEFKKIIAETLGYGEMTPEQAKKLVDLVGDINKVDDLATALRENNRSEKALNEYLAAKKKAEKSATELGKLVFNKPEILKRILSVMQLNTLGIPSLINNPIFNIVNQSTVRLPRSLIMSGIDYGIMKIGKAFGKDIPMENNIFAGQREFWNKLGYGSKQSVEQLITGLTNSDYFQKEVRTSQIHPATSMKELWAFSQGEIKLTQKQVIDKTIQATVGVPAEIVARVLNIGDKPQRFAAEGTQAAVFAKNLGLQGIDYKLFMEFPKEEAYRSYKSKGLSDEVAMKKAEDIQQRIINEGAESTFQQDNLLNDVINASFEALKKVGPKTYGFGQIVKTLNMPFVKIPLNAYWSVFNLANPEVAFLQSMTYAAKAYKTKSPLDVQQAKKWFAHGVTGLAWMGVTGTLAKAGIINSGNADDTTKKEREGEQFYENQNTINMGKFQALMQGQDPSKVKNGLLVDLKWLGNMGILMGYQARRLENMTPEQKEKGTTMMEDMMGNLTESAIDFADKGVFQNTGAMYTAISKGGRFLDSYGMNLINMATNIVHPAAFAQISRAQLPYYSKGKADSFMEELNNNLLVRSKWLRDLNNEYPPSKVSIWGEQLDKKDNTIMRLFGISKSNDDNFAQPIYKDYKRTNNTKFFPSSIKPTIKEGDNTIQLNAKEVAELETLVGQQRKQLVAPYINDMATFEGSDKKYSQLSDEEKVKNLNILYDEGYESGKFQFLQLHPQYKAPEQTEQQTEKKQESESNNKQLRSAAKEKVGADW